MKTLFTTTICRDGRVVTTIDAASVPRRRDAVLQSLRPLGDGIVVETRCQTADEKHALAKRLAEMFLREFSP